VAKIKDLQRRAQTIGVFAWCDPLALEILRLGELNIPDNVGLLGCDGLGLAEPWLEIAGLSTIRQGVEDIASEGVRFAVDLTKGIPPAERRVTIDRWIRPLTRTSTLVTRR
jgi:DNA-binding LacI/PurR family transcriptional regulator